MEDKVNDAFSQGIQIHLPSYLTIADGHFLFQNHLAIVKLQLSVKKNTDG